MTTESLCTVMSPKQSLGYKPCRSLHSKLGLLRWKRQTSLGLRNRFQSTPFISHAYGLPKYTQAQHGMAYFTKRHPYCDDNSGKPPYYLSQIWKTDLEKYTVFIAGTAIYNITFHPLAKIPGPKIRGAFFFPSHWESCAGDSAANIKALHDKFGHVVRISPNQVSFSSTQAWRGTFGARFCES